MMSPVAYDHLSVPSRATLYSLPSCDPTSTEPSPATAGDDTMGPPVAKVHQTAGLTAGARTASGRGGSARTGTSPAPARSRIAAAARTAPSPGAADGRARGIAGPHAAAGVAQPIELAVLVGRARASPRRGRSQAGHDRGQPPAVTHRPACLGPVTGNRGREARDRRGGPGETRPATDMEFGWRKVKAN